MADRQRVNLNLTPALIERINRLVRNRRELGHEVDFNQVARQLLDRALRIEEAR